MRETIRDAGPSRLSGHELALSFYLGWPILFGTILGWTGAGAIGGTLAKPLAIAYWIFGILVTRLALEISIRLVALAAPKQRTPLVILCILSVPLHMFIGIPLFSMWKALFVGYLPTSFEIEASRPFYSSITDFLLGLRANSVVLLEWTLANLVFDRMLGFPRFRDVTGYSPTRGEPTSNTQPAEEKTEFELPKFLRRSEWNLGTEVIALSAEDHYIRVHTPLGNDLVLYRFSDAISEMPNSLGMQVHRSHWVRTSAIEDFWKEGNLYRISISEGLTFPVSKRFLGLLKANGLEPKDKT